MRFLGTLLAVTLITTGSASSAQITAEQDATLTRVMKEVAEMDREIDAIQRNQETLAASAAARADEAQSLVARYPGIKVPASASGSEIVIALRDYRTARSATVRAIAEEKERWAKLQICNSIKAIEAKRAELEASDKNKHSTIQERLDLRSALDGAIADAEREGHNPCGTYGKI